MKADKYYYSYSQYLFVKDSFVFFLKKDEEMWSPIRKMVIKPSFYKNELF